MKLSLLFSAVLALIVLKAQASVVIEGSTLNAPSCELSVPFRLEPQEISVLAAKGYRPQVQRHLYRRGRVLARYDMFDVKKSAMVVDHLYLSGTKVLRRYEPTQLVSLRQFTLKIPTPEFVLSWSVATSVAPFLARSESEMKTANFAGFPTCIEK